MHLKSNSSFHNFKTTSSSGFGPSKCDPCYPSKEDHFIEIAPVRLPHSQRTIWATVYGTKKLFKMNVPCFIQRDCRTGWNRNWKRFLRRLGKTGNTIFMQSPPNPNFCVSIDRRIIHVNVPAAKQIPHFHMEKMVETG